MQSHPPSPSWLDYRQAAVEKKIPLGSDSQVGDQYCGTSGSLHLNIFQKMLILAFEAISVAFPKLHVFRALSNGHY